MNQYIVVFYLRLLMIVWRYVWWILWKYLQLKAMLLLQELQPGICMIGAICCLRVSLKNSVICLENAFYFIWRFQQIRLINYLTPQLLTHLISTKSEEIYFQCLIRKIISSWMRERRLRRITYWILWCWLLKRRNILIDSKRKNTCRSCFLKTWR